MLYLGFSSPSFSLRRSALTHPVVLAVAFRFASGAVWSFLLLSGLVILPVSRLTNLDMADTMIKRGVCDEDGSSK